MSNILCIAAHPDDETLGVGGAIARHVKDGDSVSVLILTDGVSARHGETSLQEKAALKACATLGVADVRFARLPDQRIDQLPLIEVIRPIELCICELRPHTVYTHHRGDANQDHRTVFGATLVAARPVGTHTVEQLLCYETASSTEWGPPFADWAFLPNVFVDICETLNLKLAALDAYRETFQSEIKPFPHPRSPDAITACAQVRGSAVGMTAAESFMLVRQLVRSRNGGRGPAPSVSLNSR